MTETIVIQRSGANRDGDDWVARERNARPDSGGFGPWESSSEAKSEMRNLARSVSGIDRLLIRTETGYREVGF